MNKLLDIIRELAPVMAKTVSSLSLTTGLMGKDLIIQDWRREYVGSVRTERHETKDSGFGETTYKRVPIKDARDTAEALVKAYNGMQELIRVAATEGALDETAWLIEWPADRHGPIRYYSHGEQAVIDSNEATRFARKCDAEKVAKVEELAGHKVVDHKWVVAPREQEAADVVA